MLRPTTDQQKRLLKAKIAVALRDELGRVPKQEEIEQVFLLTRVMYKACWASTTDVRNRRRPASWRSSDH